MARSPKLKVYRMPVGFHDAYVAAPSQKAAAEAWGADTSVFARKEAELVTDAELAAEPLARPGEVIKRLRGTEAEQLAALATTEDRPSRAGKNRKPSAETKPKRKPKPRPSRVALEEAEAALEEAQRRQRGESEALQKREAELARERSALEAKHTQERERLEARRTKAEIAYQEALRRWRES